MAADFAFKPAKNIRKRQAAEPEDDDDDDDDDEPLRLSRPSLPARSNIKKKPFPIPDDDGKLRFSSASSSSPLSSAAAVFRFESSGSVQVDHDSRATAASALDAECTPESKPKPEKNSPGGGREKEKVYRGIRGYSDYRAGLRRERGRKSHGPLRAPAHIRASLRFDYQPDVCKDYKETGFCGYGDACKFLHDRGDYKSGWQLDKDWEDDAKKAMVMSRRRGDGADEDEDGVGGGGNDDDGGDGDELPFACSVCRLPFRDPVVSKCKHYFCENCAFKLYSKNKKCFVCNKPTLGIFNTAHEIRKKMATLQKGT